MIARTLLPIAAMAVTLNAQSGLLFELHPDLIRFLELTPSQAAAILNNDREFNSTIAARLQRRVALEADLAAEEAKQSPNAARLGELQAGIDSVLREGRVLRDDALRRNRSILTGPQRAKLAPPAVDPDLWLEVFCAGFIPITRATTSTFCAQALVIPTAVQFHLGLDERQVRALNIIGVEHGRLFALRKEEIEKTGAELVRTRMAPTLDAARLGALRARLVDLYRLIENESQVFRARRLALLTPEQVAKVSAYPVSLFGNTDALVAASCEGLVTPADPQFVLGNPLIPAYGYTREAIECYRPDSIPGGSFTDPSFGGLFLRAPIGSIRDIP